MKAFVREEVNDTTVECALYVYAGGHLILPPYCCVFVWRWRHRQPRGWWRRWWRRRQRQQRTREIPVRPQSGSRLNKILAQTQISYRRVHIERHRETQRYRRKCVRFEIEFKTCVVLVNNLPKPRSLAKTIFASVLWMCTQLLHQQHAAKSVPAVLRQFILIYCTETKGCLPV